MDQTLAALMAAADGGSRAAAQALFDALYAELHQMARRELAKAGGAAHVSATTLLHEAYLSISGRQNARFPDRARFMAYAARVMRGLIIDHARSRCAQKRGGRFELTALDTDVAEPRPDARELTRLSDALDELAAFEPALAEIVDLKFFCGFSFAEIGTLRGVSERTVQREWERARIYLHRALNEAGA